MDPVRNLKLDEYIEESTLEPAHQFLKGRVLSNGVNRREFLTLTTDDAIPAKPAKKQLKHSQCQNRPSTSVALKGAKALLTSLNAKKEKKLRKGLLH